jgi:hypothetical protein
LACPGAWSISTRPGAEFAARLGLKPVMVPGTHEGLLAHPDEVANAILNG